MCLSILKFFGGFEILFLIIGIFLLIFWVRMLVSAIQNKELTDSERIVWVLVIILLHLIGAVLYYCLKHQKGNTPTAV